MTLPTRAVDAALTSAQDSPPDPDSPQSIDGARQRRWALGRAYPIAKQLAEILELEDDELAAVAKALRQRIGTELSRSDGR